MEGASEYLLFQYLSTFLCGIVQYYRALLTPNICIITEPGSRCFSGKGGGWDVPEDLGILLEWDHGHQHVHERRLEMSCVGTLEMLKRVQKSDWWRTWSNIMTR